MISITCAACGKKWKAPDEAAGKICKCACGQRMRLSARPAPTLAPTPWLDNPVLVLKPLDPHATPPRSEKVSVSSEEVAPSSKPQQKSATDIGAATLEHCYVCQKQVASNADSCPHCGAHTRRIVEKSKRARAFLHAISKTCLVGLSLLAVLSFLYYFLFYIPKKEEERRAQTSKENYERRKQREREKIDGLRNALVGTGWEVTERWCSWSLNRFGYGNNVHLDIISGDCVAFSIKIRRWFKYQHQEVIAELTMGTYGRPGKARFTVCAEGNEVSDWFDRPGSVIPVSRPNNTVVSSSHKDVVVGQDESSEKWPAVWRNAVLPERDVSELNAGELKDAAELVYHTLMGKAP